MITVRMLSSVAGEPTYVVGEIVQLHEDVAWAWIRDGIAEPAESQVERAIAGAGVTTRERKQ